MNQIDTAHWQRLLPRLRETCPLVTATDLDDCGQRLDLLSAKIQNRHWVDRLAARRLVLQLLAATKAA